MGSQIKDEVVLVTDMFVNTDPASGLRDRATRLIESLAWPSDWIRYGDQPEPSIDEYGDEVEDEIPTRWSYSFAIGLDDIDHRRPNWFDDVTVLLQFLRRETEREPGSEASVGVCYRSRPWHTETITIIKASWSMDHQFKEMIQRVNRP